MGKKKKIEIINGIIYRNGKKTSNKEAEKEIGKNNEISGSFINFGNVSSNGKKIPKGIFGIDDIDDLF